MKFSIVIPAWNESEFLPDTLLAINGQLKTLAETSSHEAELIVVDNNSTDTTAAIAREHGALVVFEPVNQISRARNRGAFVATGDALIFLDADSQCTAELLKEALDAIEDGRTVGGGSIISADKEIPGISLSLIHI